MRHLRLLLVTTLIAALTVGTATIADARRSTGTQGDPEALADLVSYIPTGHRYQCAQITPDSSNTVPEVVAEANAISAAVSCSDETVSGVAYYQFSDAAPMNRAYLTTVTAYDTGAAGDDCPENGTWGFNDGTDGRIICYLGVSRGGAPIAGTAARLWTDDRNNILAIANLPDGDADFAELRTWWNDEAGPLKDADSAGIVDEVNPKDGKKLLASIPKATRSSCEVIDPTEALADTNAVASLFYEAAVACTNPAKGIESVYYYSLDDDIIQEYFDEDRSPTQAQLDEAGDDAVCPTYGTWSVGKGTKKREVGSYACFFVGTATGEYPQWAWTDTDQGILGSAAATDADPATLEKWWESSASGPLQP